MRCPTLGELTSPPQGKMGWPWTEETTQLPDTMSNGSSWPRLTAITPSFNQEPYLEETLRSVLLQGYPDLEYIVIDGGSTDASVDIIRKYAPWLTYWTSERDEGQAHAINKGIRRMTGDIVAWVNSDDIYLRGAFARVAFAHKEYPTALLQGKGFITDSELRQKSPVSPNGLTLRNVINYWERSAVMFVPSLFFPASVVREAGFFDQELHYTFDIDILCRALLTTSVRYLDYPLAMFRWHQTSKTISEPQQFLLEWAKVALRYWHHVNPDVKEAQKHITKYLIKRASGRFRSLDVVNAIKLAGGSLEINRKETVKAAFLELGRLMLGGRLTGRT